MIKITRPPCPNPSALKTDYKSADNKLALKNASHDKCMYCEGKISDTYFGDVEHIKPKKPYPRLEFMWDNLGFACARCNNAKNDKYSEALPYINPYSEDPTNHVAALGALMVHANGSERGELTIIDIGLNRSELVERRLERMRQIQVLVDRIKRQTNPTLKSAAIIELNEECKDDKPYALTTRCCLKTVYPEEFA